MKIVAVTGSPREASNSTALAQAALDEARKLGVDALPIALANRRIEPCLGHDGCGSLDACLQKDDASDVLREFYAADGIILASPVYFFNVTAQMKAFIDRNLFYYRHKQKARARSAGIIVVAGGGGIEDTAAPLLRFITISTTLPREKVLRVEALARRAGDIAANAEALERARWLGRTMAQQLLGS